MADTRFAPLGLVLMTTLARTSHLIKVQAGYTAISDKSNVGFPSDEDQGSVSGAIDADLPASTESFETVKYAWVLKERSPEQALVSQDCRSLRKITRSRKRRRKGNAIDDIFNLLV